MLLYCLAVKQVFMRCSEMVQLNNNHFHIVMQVDFNLPQRFNITYVDSNSEKRRPIMIHRAVLGSLERFFGVLIEHYAGDFPLWLSPIQVRVLPVTDTQVSVVSLSLFTFIFSIKFCCI